MGKVLPFVIPVKPEDAGKGLRSLFSDDEVAEIEQELLDELDNELLDGLDTNDS